MVVHVGVVRPFFTGYAYQDEYYQGSYATDPGFVVPKILDDSTPALTDYRNKYNGQFQGSARDPLTYALDMSYDQPTNTWNKNYGGMGTYQQAWNPYEICSIKTVLDKYTTALNYDVTMIDDRTIHNNAISGYDVLVFGHNEYVSQPEYNNLKTWINTSGGTCVFMDGNVLFVKIAYDSTTTPITVAAVDGHGFRWHPSTKQYTNRQLDFPGQGIGLHFWEHWTADGRDEDGTTPSDAGDKENYWNFIFKIDPQTGLSQDPDQGIEAQSTATSVTTLYRNPWFPIGTHEDDYIVNPSNPSIVTISDYGGSKKTVATNPQRDIRCWYQLQGHGRIIHMGTYWDQHLDTSHGSTTKPLKAAYHWFARKIMKPYFVAKPVTP